MFQMLVNSEGGLTTAGYVTCIVVGVILFLLGSVFARKDTQNVNDNCACSGDFLCENLFSAMGRKCHVVQYVIYCTGCKLVRCTDGYFSRFNLWNLTVYPGAICTFFLPGML